MKREEPKRDAYWIRAYQMRQEAKAEKGSSGAASAGRHLTKEEREAVAAQMRKEGKL